MYRFLPSSSSPFSLSALPFRDSQLEKLLNMYIHTTVMGNTIELNFQGIAAAAVPLHRWNNNKKKATAAAGRQRKCPRCTDRSTHDGRAIHTTGRDTIVLYVDI